MFRYVVSVENANNVPDGQDERHMHEKNNVMKNNELKDNMNTIKLEPNAKLYENKFVPNIIYRVEKRTLLLFPNHFLFVHERVFSFSSFKRKILINICSICISKWTELK